MYILSEITHRYWNHLGIKSREIISRTLVVNSFIFVLIFFWVTPVTFFASFLKLETLQKILPWLVSLADKNKYVKGSIQSILPTLGFTIFFAIVPSIMSGGFDFSFFFQIPIYNQSHHIKFRLYHTLQSQSKKSPWVLTPVIISESELF